ncbi:carcinine hydrolase/isopenicillin-N N-acyltransferase family protein [Rhodoferax fermentans]|uniref:Peptidase C45 hydrolase domain-containing protein n=1 Tax=Rhodoferax fermentans TaxID=28066 RepID=A0A1T1AXF4_RHOFE|nr:carcinine hydrolase/isopenicillin-N N-acyltransferase family protein [Rhodoferax fermentans]MBK1682538.1 hypothetical protein [Rhodoferax fermentans]OOV08648.1 hypothetical protein RF819_19840 [Rhodoferax fermentans]
MRGRILLLVWSVLLAPWSAWACTLWAVAGTQAGGGTLISKNRDWVPDHWQYLKKVSPKTGLKFLGLYAEGNNAPGLKAGVNERGLSIVSASSNIPRSVREAQPDKHGIMVQVLSGYSTVRAVLDDAALLFSKSRANFFMLSDRRMVVQVEVGLDGTFSVKSRDSGSLAHTNHYLDPALAALYNQKIGTSSATRLNRIQTLLGQQTELYTLDQFSAFSHDQHDGANNSLWRSGREHTMASWIVAVPAQGAPRLRVLLANPGQQPSTHELLLDDAFWQATAKTGY